MDEYNTKDGSDCAKPENLMDLMPLNSDSSMFNSFVMPLMNIHSANGSEASDGPMHSIHYYY
jgi:hypothetical protein